MIEAIRKALWATVLITGGIAWSGSIVSGISLSAIPIIIPPLVLSLVGLAALRKPWWPLALVRSLNAIELLLLMALTGYAGAIVSYLVFATTTGYVDEGLAHVDGLLGFNWVSVWLAANEYTWIRSLGELSYNSFFISPLLIIAGLLFTGRALEAYSFVFAYLIGVLLTNIVFAAFPAQAAFQHFLPHQPDLWGDGPKRYLAAIDQLRSGALVNIEIDKLSGIVTFPSFHASAAFLFIWASWPVRWLRWPMFILNTAMMISITFVGGHYVVDLFGGVWVACVAVVTVSRFQKTFELPSQGSIALGVDCGTACQAFSLKDQR